MLKNSSVSTKIILPILIILIFGNIINNYITTTQMDNLAKNSAKDSLSMLTDSIFITLRNAMNTGDPAIIKHAEEQSRKEIKGLSKLTVAKSKETIAMYSPEVKFTTDKDILEAFRTKKEIVLDINENGSHFFRVLKPMIATNDCIMCHANQKKGDVIGVIDLSFNLDKADKTISQTIWFIVFISMSIIFITILVTWYVAKKTTEPLKELKNDLDTFFSFLAHERNDIKPFKVNSLDEIGQMVQSINENVQKTIDGVDKDAKAIKESSNICKEVSIGNLSVKIDIQANNPEINNLIEIVNELISSLNYNVNRVLVILNKYSTDDYHARINSKGNTTGEIKELFEQVDFLGDTLTKLSTQNLKNGKALQQTSKVFSKNVQMLADSSKEQASSLQMAREDLEDIAENIKLTTKNSSKMATLASDVNRSSLSGKELATKTSAAMIEVNEKVNAINDSISIIDQISFQTNILSLNAAVESATAGESGKGFAVVAGEVRNLAARSSEAAREIKNLVELATEQTNIGSSITKEMIEGYEQLNENISVTTALIDEVAEQNNIQSSKIEHINKEILNIDKVTQENAKIASDTNIVAQQASDIAQKIVDDAGGKEFNGKDNIQIRKKLIDPDYTGVEHRKIEKSIKSNKNFDTI
jgi:methyl-accepting chemotaxis protein